MKETYTKPEISIRHLDMLNANMTMLNASEIGVQQSLDAPEECTEVAAGTLGEEIQTHHYDAWGDARGNRGGFSHDGW